MSIGNRVYLKKPEAPQELLEAFAQIPAANIADSIGRLCAMHPRVHLMSSPDKPVTVGRAITVKSRAGDNMMLHKALNMAKENDVILVTNDTGESYRALMGEIMFTFAAYKKLAGIILDGPLRDIDAVRDMKLPIYAQCTNPGGPYKDGTGEVNVPVSCGGISVKPGDIVVMDADGIVVVPLQDAEETLRAAQAFQKQDAAKVVAAATGQAKREWVEKKLAEHGTEIIDDCYLK